ncbi:IS5/IS1182 family transposase [Saccharomonospora piscinae]|uniref:IS5/IS1182 family transposase n=1 Tax=Saccharomonospora piscinae TaxID=687388 RepID=UPI000466D116|nr:IS5/IS1182 family transposase [Saccharomonospora piscinae]
MLSYPSAINLSSQTLHFLTTRLRRHRVVIGSRWRKLPPQRQALLVLAHLRNGDTYARLGAGFGVGVDTVYRYVTEAVEVLAAHGPELSDAVRAARGKAFVILDGTLIAIDRVHHQRPYYPGKHKCHGVNVQLLADPAGRLMWASPALPGSTHDLTAARRHGLIATLTSAAIVTFADKGYLGAGGAVGTPYRGRGLVGYRKRFNRHHAKIRGVGERAVATLKDWRILAKVRCSPHRITHLLAAILTLHHTPA